MAIFIENAETGGYAQIKTEVAIPVRKIED
jgi:hypothetical protein